LPTRLTFCENKCSASGWRPRSQATMTPAATVPVVEVLPKRRPMRRYGPWRQVASDSRIWRPEDRPALVPCRFPHGDLTRPGRRPGGAAIAPNLLAARSQRPSWRSVQRSLNASPSFRRPCQDGRDKRERCSATAGLGNRTPRHRQRGTSVEKVDGVYTLCRGVASSSSACSDEGAAGCADFAGWIGRIEFDPSPSPARQATRPQHRCNRHNSTLATVIKSIVHGQQS